MFVDKGITPPKDKIVAKIEEVDLQKRHVYVQERSLGRVMAAFRQTSAAFNIPAQGEFWYITRHGFEWLLDRKIDSLDQHNDLTGMNPGDTRVTSGGTVHISAPNGLQSNSRPIGVTRNEVFTTSGSVSSVALSEAPVDIQTVQVFVDGVLAKPSEVSINGSNDKQLDFSPSLSVTAWYAVYYQAI
jgi:hypothetical protein